MREELQDRSRDDPLIPWYVVGATALICGATRQPEGVAERLMNAFHLHGGLQVMKLTFNCPVRG